MKKLFFLTGLIYMLGIGAATHVVTNTLDSGAGSLRQAIIDANADPSTPRIINFSIDSGVQIIQPGSALPALTASHIIVDGSTQPGWSTNNPMIVLDGFIADFDFNGITLDGAHTCTIQALAINHGFLHGIEMLNDSNNNEIYECFLGTDQMGTHTSANSFGIAVRAFGEHHNSNTIIGAPHKGNLISGNTHAGIFLSGNINNIVIQSNKIGTDITGENALPNNAGIAIVTLPINENVICDGVQIGGALAQEGNIIAGNHVGIVAGLQPMSNVTIEGNIYDLDTTGTLSIPNTSADVLLIQSTIPEVTDLLVQNNIN